VFGRIVGHSRGTPPEWPESRIEAADHDKMNAWLDGIIGEERLP
jgi:hypothetical protein